MKLHMWTWLIVVGLILASGLVKLGQLLNESEAENRTDIDNWIDKNLSEALSRKLNQPVDEILKVVKGSFKPELINLINKTIRSVNLTFNRLPRNRDIKICLDVSYKDGTSFSNITERNWDALPESVRAEFLRGGRNTAQRPWEFHWVNQR